MLTALAERPTLPTFPAWLDALLEVPPDVTTDWPCCHPRSHWVPRTRR